MADIDLQGTSISDLTTKTVASVADDTLAYIAFDDTNVDPVDTFKTSLNDIMTGGAASSITWHATDMPATNATKGLYGVTTGTYRGLYICSGTNRYRILQFEEDGA